MKKSKADQDQEKVNAWVEVKNASDAMMEHTYAMGRIAYAQEVPYWLQSWPKVFVKAFTGLGITVLIHEDLDTDVPDKSRLVVKKWGKVIYDMKYVIEDFMPPVEMPKPRKKRVKKV